MKDSIAVSVQNVSKKFLLFGSPKDRLREALYPFKKKYHREFWALKDINIEVPKGATLGIVGRNGSGKSTLLQVICSVLRPTSGKVTVNGRISALLELGAGFNPDFTGRDNVLLNGALMGFSRKEMEERLDLIEEFADIGEFFDQPVKIYSSGMFVRLAFAAAINVDPDILIVDEALAVGDAKFQHKCYGKFLEFQKKGKTILFVSHSTDAIVRHCDYAVLLENGAIIKNGKPNDVVNSYLELLFTGTLSSTEKLTPDIPTSVDDNQAKPQVKSALSRVEKFLEEVLVTDNCIYRNSYNKNEYRFGDKRAEIIDYLIASGDNYDPVTVKSGDVIDVYLKAKFHQAVKYPLFGFSIKTIDGIVVYASNTQYGKTHIHSAKEFDIIVFRFSIKMNLVAGHFFTDLGIAERVSGKDLPIDVRYGLIHLAVQGKNKFDGFVELESNFQEISRKTINMDKIII